ncbi:hypothetical protein Tco_0173754 [Tanacetum coccineum]
MIYRIYVDGGSATKILYDHCFQQLSAALKANLLPPTTLLIGFTGQALWPLGVITLPLTMHDYHGRGSKTIVVEFMVVQMTTVIVLSVDDKLNYLEHPIPAAPVPANGQQVPPEALPTHNAWIKGSKEVAYLMLMIMDLDIQRKLENLGAYDILQELKTLFAQAEHKLF